MYPNERLTAGQETALVKKLGGWENIPLILSGALRCQLVALLDGPTVGAPTKGLWRTVHLRVDFGALGGYLGHIEGAGMTVDEKVEYMLRAVRLEGQKFSFKVALRRPADLGFENNALAKTPYGDIYRAATEEYGLGLCPPELAFALRLAWTDQSRNDWIIVASKGVQMQEPVGGLGLFRLDHDREGRPSLEWANGNDNCKFPNHTKFAFVDMS